TGGTVVNAGTLQLKAAQTGTGPIALNDGATLDLRGDANQLQFHDGTITTSSAALGTSTLSWGVATSTNTANPELRIQNLTVSPGTTLTVSPSTSTVADLAVMGQLDVRGAILKTTNGAGGVTPGQYFTVRGTYLDDAGSVITTSGSLSGQNGVLRFATGT